MENEWNKRSSLSLSISLVECSLLRRNRFAAKLSSPDPINRRALGQTARQFVVCLQTVLQATSDTSALEISTQTLSLSLSPARFDYLAICERQIREESIDSGRQEPFIRSQRDCVRSIYSASEAK